MQLLFGIHIMKLRQKKVEKVQKTAARWVCRRWHNTSSVDDMLDQGRRRLMKSGPAMKHQIRFKSAEGTSLERARVGRGVRGISPEKNLYFWTSVETILMHFVTISAFEALLIL